MSDGRYELGYHDGLQKALGLVREVVEQVETFPRGMDIPEAVPKLEGEWKGLIKAWLYHATSKIEDELVESYEKGS